MISAPAFSFNGPKSEDTSSGVFVSATGVNSFGATSTLLPFQGRITSEAMRRLLYLPFSAPALVTSISTYLGDDANALPTLTSAPTSGFRLMPPS